MAGTSIPGFYTPEQAAEVLDVTPAAVRVWLRNGDIDGVRVGEESGGDDRRPWLIPQKAVEKKAKEPRDPRGRKPKNS